MWCWCGEGDLARATHGFASLNCNVLPSSAGLSNSHLKATAGQSYRCQQANSKQSFYLTWTLGRSGIIKRTGRTKAQARVLCIAHILVTGQSSLMLWSDWGAPAQASSFTPPTHSHFCLLKPTFKLVRLRGLNKLHLGATSAPVLMPAEITVRCFCINIKIHSTVRLFFSEYFHP